jgi:uncharacterized protein YecE (DUF72 family)
MLESFLAVLPRNVEWAFEFRDKSWFVDDTFDALRRRDGAFCCFDSPRLECPLVATASFAYVRFHGSGVRNGGNYSDRLLEDWAKRLRRLAEDVDNAYVYFNNDPFGHAVRNAMTIADMLGAPLAEDSMVERKRKGRPNKSGRPLRRARPSEAATRR